jgi:uncharacterized protein (TIGR00270 family)
MQCDLCGKEAALVLAEIEGSRVRACPSCAAYGKVVGQVVAPPKRPLKGSAPGPLKASNTHKETILMVRPDAGALIKAAREKRNLPQADLARLLNEKASVIHNVETGHGTLSLDLARKFERALRVRLVESYTEDGSATGAKDAEGLTIGDLLSPKN